MKAINSKFIFRTELFFSKESFKICINLEIKT